MTDGFFQPVSGSVLPRFAGIPTFMRLPHVPPDHPRRAEVEIGLFGIPWDGGTSNRPGARHGPRALRDASTMVRGQHGVTGARPFAAAACADLGDVGCNPVDMMATLEEIRSFVAGMAEEGIRPLAMAGDHLTTLPILRALGRDRPLGLVLLDSHTDLYPPYFATTFPTHGNPFRMAVEEGLIDPARSVMIGMRGTCYDDADRAFARDHGITVVPMHEVFARGVADVTAQARAIAGNGATYLSFDIDFVDPAFAPGTGTPEVGGPTSAMAMEMLRALKGLDIAGADLVEVSPPFDNGGITSWLGASVAFEILCLMTAGAGAG